MLLLWGFCERCLMLEKKCCVIRSIPCKSKLYRRHGRGSAVVMEGATQTCNHDQQTGFCWHKYMQNAICMAQQCSVTQGWRLTPVCMQAGWSRGNWSCEKTRRLSVYEQEERQGGREGGDSKASSFPGRGRYASRVTEYSSVSLNLSCIRSLSRTHPLPGNTHIAHTPSQG